MYLTRRRRRHPQRFDRKQRYSQFEETDYHQQQRGGSLAAQGHRERDRRNTFSKRPDRGQPPEISKGVLAHRTAHWVHLGRNEVEQSQHEQIQCRGDGRDEGREAHGVIPARRP